VVPLPLKVFFPLSRGKIAAQMRTGAFDKILRPQSRELDELFVGVGIKSRAGEQLSIAAQCHCCLSLVGQALELAACPDVPGSCGLIRSCSSQDRPVLTHDDSGY
jgi:hypothetical protein